MKIKKAAVGSTLTWIVATFIICFILVLYFVFLTITYLGADEKKIINLGYNSDKLMMTKSFVDFLEFSSGVKSNADWIAQWADGDDLKVLESVGKDAEKRFGIYECYAINIFAEGRTFHPSVNGFSNYGARLYSGHLESDLANKGIFINLISNKGKIIKLNYYGGKCS